MMTLPLTVDECCPDKPVSLMERWDWPPSSSPSALRSLDSHLPSRVDTASGPYPDAAFDLDSTASFYRIPNLGILMNDSKAGKGSP